jgi:putative DNA primase/helicase
MNFSEAAIDDLKGRMLCHEVAGKWVTLRKSGSAYIGPCPLCSRDLNKKTATKFKATDDRWMCAACMNGGDVIELVCKVESKSFVDAVEWLGGVQDIDLAEAARRKAARDAAAAQQAKTSAEYRERERGTLYEAFKRALKKQKLAGSSLEDYFRLRALELYLQHHAGAGLIRCIEAMPYYDSGKKDAAVIHRGPAMLACYVKDERFAALHITYLDPRQTNGKLALDASAEEDRPAKKMRGSKTGAVIKLVEPPAGTPVTRVFIGEGIETTLSVWCAMFTLGLLRAGDAFYAAGDLGNLGGKAAESVPHPTLKNEAGRTRRVPGPWPAVDSPGIAIPDSVTSVIILGDGDSDPFTTRCAMARASVRFAAPGRDVRVAMAPDGDDYNDIWRRTRDAAAVVALIEAGAPLAPDDVLGTATAPARASAPNSAAPNVDGEAGVQSSSLPHEPEPDPPTPFAAGGDESDFPDHPAVDSFSAFAAGAAAPSAAAESEKPSHAGGNGNSGASAFHGRPGTRSANRARWGGPPRKYGDGKEALDRWMAFFPMTELGLIERYVQRQKNRLKFCDALGWLLWNGKCWTRTGAKGAAIAAGHEVVRAIQDEAESIRDTEFDEIVALKPGKKKDDDPKEIMLSDLLASFGRESETKAKMTLQDHAASYLEVEIDELDADPFAINVMNGTLLVRRKWTGALPMGWQQVNANIRMKPHDQNDLITKMMPVSFDADAQCARYDDFMEVVQPSGTMRDFLDEWNGYALTGDASEQKLLFHYGTGKNGKSTESAVRLFIVGDYGKSIPIETFVSEGRARSAGQATPDLAMLRRVRNLVTSEPEKGWKLNEALIKVLTGGDEVPVRELHRAYFMLKPEFKMSIGGNFKPNISGGEAESGIWRRVVLVPWMVKITKEQRDPHLIDKLKLESAGILNRWLAGLARWLQRGHLALPEEVTRATEEFRVASDWLGRFLEECTRPSETGSIQSSALHALYAAWCKVAGEREWSPTIFGKALDERGIIRVKRSSNFWDGIEAIKNVNDFVDFEGKPIVRTAPSAGAEAADTASLEGSRIERWNDDDDVVV